MAKLTGAGTDDKKKVAIAAGLGVAVLALAIHTIFGGPSVPEPAATMPSAQLTAAGRAAAARGTAPAPGGAAESRIDPRLHTELMAENENYLYAGSGRDIFSMQAAAPPPVKIEKVLAPVRPSMESASAAAQAAGPPPISLKFFGYVAPTGGTPQRAFLLNGENVYVAAVGDVVSHRYKVVGIAPVSIRVEDLPYNDTQTLPLIRR